MLRSELYELENAVELILADKKNDSPSADPERLAEKVKHVRSLCANLKQTWTHELLSSAKEHIIKRYIQYHQAGIIQLSNQFSGNVSALVITDIELKRLYDEVNHELEEVLDFLRHKFYQYFDVDHQVSQYCCRLQCACIQGYLSGLKEHSPAVIDKTLINTIVVSVEEVIEDALYSGISYRQADHVLGILRLTDHLTNVEPCSTTEILARALYKQNFNSLHFYTWYRESLIAKIPEYADVPERVNVISQEIGRLASIFVHPDKVFEQESPPIDQLLLNWLREEREHTAGASRRPVKPNGDANFPLNLSVPQFAMFIRVFCQVGCFPVANVSRITRFFTGHFTTKKQAHISIKSFARAFYSLDQACAAIVRDYLQRMLNYLNKTYFP